MQGLKSLVSTLVDNMDLPFFHDENSYQLHAIHLSLLAIVMILALFDCQL
jgi:hypothetical protein